jgi:hypothetical protein
MEVSCPSCGLKHQTDDYPGAVEIPCSCGYSVFIDDAASSELSPESLDPAEPFINSPPLSFESQDEALQIRESRPPKPDPILSNNLTAPDQLPKEMPYDPYELGDKILSDIDRESENSPEGEGPELDLEGLRAPPAPRTMPKPMEGGPPPLSNEFQKQLLSRIQTASIGRFLGNSFNVQVINLPEEKELELLGHIEKFLANQVWIREEVQRRGINLKEMAADRKFENIPESLAVEIYLRSFEMGAICKFERSDYGASEF